MIWRLWNPLLFNWLLARATIGAGFMLTMSASAEEETLPDCAGGSCPSPYSGEDGYSPPEEPACNLWLGPSPIKEAEEHGFGLGVFTGRNIPKGSSVEMDGELLIPIFDSDFAHHPPLREYIWDGELMPEVPLESETGAYLFVPGLGGISPCTDQNYNGEWRGAGDSPNAGRHNVAQDSAGVHRSTHPTAGSFSYRHKVTFTAVRDIVAGEELTVKCGDDAFDGGAYYLSRFHSNDVAVACIDHVRAGTSGVAGAGQGLFALQRIAKDSVITSTPLIPIHRKEMDYRIQGRNVDGKQLLLNYCYGHPRSDLLLLPYGPLVNYINHSPEKKPNAVIRWHPSDNNKNDNLPRRQQHHHPELLDLPGETVAETHGKGLMMDIVALRDIAPNEEIFIDYGPDWTEAWKSHVGSWKFDGKAYVSAWDYNRAHEKEPLRTIYEEPYPVNLQTACFYPMDLEPEANQVGDNVVHAYKEAGEAQHCFRPCVVLERYSNSGLELYKTKFLPMDDTQVILECVLEHVTVIKDVPRQAIRIVDRLYTTDVFLENAFRHEIGVPDGFYPEMWMKKKMRRRKETNAEGDAFKRKKT